MAEVNYVSPLKSPDVFLSYSHDDAELVEKIAEALEKAGFSCWIDTERLRHDDDFNIKIQDGIRDCLVFISFLSKTYVNKAYCQQEFSMARDERKSVLSVTIDDVSKNTNRNAAYMFGFLAGKTLKNYQKSLTLDDVPFVTAFLEETYQLRKLKKYYQTGDENDIPTPSLPDAVMDTLRYSIEKQSELRENYALGKVNGILFPAVRDVKTGELFRDETEKMTSLTRYLADSLESIERRSLFLYGEGGMGKTVAMLETAKYLLSKDIPAIYIPLSKMKTEEAIDEYIEVTVLGGSDMYKKILYDFMSLDMAGEPSVVLLFDGINELTSDTREAQQIVYRIREKFIDGYKGTDVIITSRWDDPAVTGQIRDAVTPLEMQRFDTGRINRYLESVGVAPVSNPKMLSVLSTPLLLTLYANVEQHIEKYSKINGIKLYNPPDSPAKILRNFFLTQLFRASEEPYFDRTSHYVLLEYLLPAIAFEMVKDKDPKGKTDSDRIFELTDEIEEKEGRYQWFRKDVLRKLTGGNTKVDTELLLSTAVSSLHFLVPLEDDEYEFIHQVFRDYFAAYHIVNEINAFARDRDRAREETSVLTLKPFSEDILAFAADISEEHTAAPEKTEEGIDYHGKTAPGEKPSSAFEGALGFFRGSQGEAAQNAVYNLYNVMRLGRNNDLSFCDLSQLDMRKCVLAGTRFTDWYKDKVYPSVFDGAFINTEAFIRDGHSAMVTALCSDGEDLIFSGDSEGNIRISSVSSRSTIKLLKLSDDAVADIAYHPDSQRIAAVSKGHLLEYSLKTGQLNITENTRRDRDFRYAGFDKNGRITVSHTLEPLMFRYLTDELCEGFPDNLDFDVPAACAKWHPTEEKFIRSRMGLTITATVRGDDGKKWWMHPAFKEMMQQSSEGFDTAEVNMVRETFEKIRNDKNRQGKKNFLLTTTAKGAPVCYIIRVGDSIYLYNNQRRRIIKKIHFPKGIDMLYHESRFVCVYSDALVVYFDMQLSLYTAMLNIKYYNSNLNNGVVRCISFNADGSRFFVTVGNSLLEFETETLALIKHTVLPALAGAVCSLGDKIVVSAGKKILLMSSNHATLHIFEESNKTLIKNVIDDIEGDGCYLITNGSSFKKLNRDLVLQRSRKVNFGASFQWARHNVTGKIYMLFKATDKYPFGRIYDFETDESQLMNESFRVIDLNVNEEDKIYYPMDSDVLAFNKRPPYNKIHFTNYSGICIYGCSFKDIKGSISDESGIDFIVSNGGSTNG